MSEEALAFVENLLKTIGIPYAFMQWNDEWPPEGYYFTGTYIEHDSPTLEEDGHQEYTFILRGYTRGSWMLLEEAKAKIKKNTQKSVKAILPSGGGIVISYGTATPVPTGDMALKNVKINLSVQEWSVN